MSSVWHLFAMSRSFLEESCLRRNRFRDYIPTGFGESLIFQLFPQIMNVIKGKVSVSISTIIIFSPLLFFDGALLSDRLEQAL